MVSKKKQKFRGLSSPELAYAFLLALAGGVVALILLPKIIQSNIAKLPGWFWPMPQDDDVNIDYTVLHNEQPSITVKAIHGYGAREASSMFYPIKPGDHVVMKVWIKTYSPIDFIDPTGTGGHAGLDMWTSDSMIAVLSSGFVNWNSDWIQKTLDFVVPSTYIDFDGNAQTPAKLGMWLQLKLPPDTSAMVWFSEPELYINP